MVEGEKELKREKVGREKRSKAETVLKQFFSSHQDLLQLSLAPQKSIGLRDLRKG